MWKSIKDHYRIGHIVIAGDGCIKIGSPYVSDLLLIFPDGSLKWGPLGKGNNDDLDRYHAEMSADPAKLAELYAAKDTFAADLPVYTYSGAEIIEKRCEAYGWPNVTHDGFLMYENSYSKDKAEVVAWAKRNAELGIKSGKEYVARAEKKLADDRAFLATEQANLAKLMADYPAPNDPSDKSVPSDDPPPSLEISDLRWEYEDSLPPMTDDEFNAIFKASRVDVVRIYPFVENSAGERIWLSSLIP